MLLIAIGLSFPFWGDRPGYERQWVDWGFGVAILYLLVFGGFVYLMVNKYSPSVDGSEDMGIPELPEKGSPNKTNEKNSSSDDHGNEEKSQNK